MTIFLATIAIDPPYQTAMSYFHDLARLDRCGENHIAQTPEKADVIFFIDAHQLPDWKLSVLRSHPLVRRFPQKCMMYNERDRPWCALPGVYTSMPRAYFDHRRQRAGVYHVLPQEREVGLPTDGTDLLFSFLGAKSHPVRKAIVETISHPRAVLQLSGANFFDFQGTSEEREERLAQQKQFFADLTRRSKFILCPRGQGNSSLRLYETMAAARVPVIISDEWQAPEGPDWDSFSLRVEEKHIREIPQLLEAREPEFEAMAQRAREAYVEWFALDVRFHHWARMCAELLQSGSLGPARNPLFDRQFLKCGAVFYGLQARSTAVKGRNWLRRTVKR